MERRAGQASWGGLYTVSIPLVSALISHCQVTSPAGPAVPCLGFIYVAQVLDHRKQG